MEEAEHKLIKCKTADEGVTPLIQAMRATPHLVSMSTHNMFDISSLVSR
jgi:hypothetical protein